MRLLGVLTSIVVLMTGGSAGCVGRDVCTHPSTPFVEVSYSAHLPRSNITDVFAIKGWKLAPDLETVGDSRPVPIAHLTKTPPIEYLATSGWRFSGPLDPGNSTFVHIERLNDTATSPDDARSKMENDIAPALDELARRLEVAHSATYGPTLICLA